MKVCIIGLGLIGGSIAKSMRESGFSDLIFGVDSSEAHCAQALKLHLIDEAMSLEVAVQHSDLILIATPVSTIPELALKVLDMVNDRQVVMDLGSTKYPLLEAIKNHPARAQFMAAHPMAGTEYSGPNAAVSGLFHGKCCVLCDTDLSSEYTLNIACQLFESIGMRIVHLGGAEHDLHTAYVSHISHIASFALALTVLEKEKEEDRIFELASGGFSSTVRLAKSNPDTWIPIFQQNRDNVLDVLDEFINTVSKFRTLLIKKDFEQFHQLIAQANSIKRIIS